MSLIISSEGGPTRFRNWYVSKPAVPCRYKAAQISVIAGYALANAATIYAGVLLMNQGDFAFGAVTIAAGFMGLAVPVGTLFHTGGGYDLYDAPPIDEPRKKPLLMPSCVLYKQDEKELLASNSREGGGYYYQSIA